MTEEETGRWLGLALTLERWKRGLIHTLPKEEHPQEQDALLAAARTMALQLVGQELAGSEVIIADLGADLGWKLTCPHCGAVVEPGQSANYCSRCGHRLRADCSFCTQDLPEGE